MLVEIKKIIDDYIPFINYGDDWDQNGSLGITKDIFDNMSNFVIEFYKHCNIFENPQISMGSGILYVLYEIPTFSILISIQRYKNIGISIINLNNHKTIFSKNYLSINDFDFENIKTIINQ